MLHDLDKRRIDFRVVFVLVKLKLPEIVEVVNSEVVRISEFEILLGTKEGEKNLD